MFLAAFGLLPADRQAWSGNEANFVLYDHHTEKQGTVSVMLLNDFGRGAPGEPSYSAQMLMIERAMTDQWETELMMEGQKTSGEGYQYTGWRWENRYRLFDYGTFLNPGLYVEYENLKPTTKYVMEISGRTDKPENTERNTERILETRLILGQDLSDKLSVSFNWINETDIFVNTAGRTDFGYALGLNYMIYNAKGGEARHPGVGAYPHQHAAAAGADDGRWGIAHIKLGAELFGGLGDTSLGMTINPAITEHYLGLNVMTHLQNGFHFMIGGAVGLTEVSQRGLVRLGVGYEFN
ncbi:MAG: hypothetical protein HY244_09115 [Rhizobiales bacterium]|nr:hypothetical protein [Hyphomicrobiales bacterium]